MLLMVVLAGCGTDGEGGVSPPAVTDGDVELPVIPPPSEPMPAPEQNGRCSSITVFPDADGDGHGDPAGATASCNGVPAGFVTIGNDCDDACADCSPVSVEMCDGFDNDCDGRVDEGLSRATFYRDRDGDGFGADRDTTTTACGPAPDGYATHGGDCDDDDGSVHPAEPETCNAADDDCDGLVDEGIVAPEATALLIGETASTFRELSIAAFSGGWVAAWSEPGRRVVYTVIDADGVPVTGALPVDPSSAAAQTHPHVAVTEASGPPTAFVTWLEAGSAIRARSIGVGGGETSAVFTLAEGAAFARLPVETVVAGGTVVALWLERREPEQTRGVLVDPVAGAVVGEPALLHECARRDPDNYGPSAATLPGDPASLYLGFVDAGAGDTRAVGYVSRVRIGAGLERTTERVRLDPRSDAARRVVLTTAGSALLAFVARGSAPDEQTDVFRIAPGTSTTLLRATRVPHAEDGFVVDATPTGAGAHVLLSDATPTDRRSLDLGICGSSGAHVHTGTIASVLAPWASVAHRATGGAVLYTGRISTSDVDPGVWLRRYGCE
jgi:hypothetical protein